MNHQPCGIHDNTKYPFIYFPTPKSLAKNVCIETCPDKDTTTLNCLKNDLCKDGTLQQDVSGGIIIYQTIPFAGKVCIPLNKEYLTQVQTAINVNSAEQVATALRNTWVICSSSILVGLLLAFFFLYFVRLAAGSVVWTFILLIVICVSSLSALFYFQYLQLTNPPKMDTSVTSNSSYQAM